MSFSDKIFAVAVAITCAACGTLTGGADATSDSYLSLRVDPGPALNGSNLTYSAGDSLIVRATVIGDAAAYEIPTVTAADPTMVETRPDGSARVLHPSTLVLSATAAAKSSRTRPSLLRAAGTLTLACTMEARAGITLTLVDSATGVQLSGPGDMRLKVTDGTYTDSLRTLVVLIGFWGGAYERAGTYTATVDADGYQPWRRDGII